MEGAWALGRFPAAVPQQPAALLTCCWRVAAACRVAEALLRCLACPGVDPRLGQRVAYKLASCTALVFGPAIALLRTVQQRLVAQSPDSVLQFAALVLPAAAAATQLRSGEATPFRVMLARSLLRDQVLDSFVGQATEILHSVEVANPGKAVSAFRCHA